MLLGNLHMGGEETLILGLPIYVCKGQQLEQIIIALNV